MSDEKLRAIRDLLDRSSAGRNGISAHCRECGGEQALDPFDADRCVFGHADVEG
jgi:hypothetical protein